MKLTCWLDCKDLTELKDEAEALGVSATSIIAKLVSKHLAAKRKKAQGKRL